MQAEGLQPQTTQASIIEFVTVYMKRVREQTRTNASRVLEDGAGAAVDVIESNGCGSERGCREPPVVSPAVSVCPQLSALVFAVIMLRCGGR